MSKKKNRRPYDNTDGYTPSESEMALDAYSNDTDEIVDMEGIAGEVQTSGETIHIRAGMSQEEIDAITDVISDPNTEITTNAQETEEAVINDTIVSFNDTEPIKEEVKEETKKEAEERRVVKTVVKKPFEGEKTTGRWRLCIVKGASELRWIQIKKKIKELAINCDFDEKEKTIYSAVFGRKSDAIALRKELQRKGLSPSIEEVK